MSVPTQPERPLARPAEIAAAFSSGAASGRNRVVVKREGGGAAYDPERDALEAWAEERNDVAEQEERASVGIGGALPTPAQGA